MAKDFTKFLKRDTLQFLSETGEMRSLLKTDIELCMQPMLYRQAENSLKQAKRTNCVLQEMLATSLNKRAHQHMLAIRKESRRIEQKI